MAQCLYGNLTKRMKLILKVILVVLLAPMMVGFLLVATVALILSSFYDLLSDNVEGGDDGTGHHEGHVFSSKSASL